MESSNRHATHICWSCAGAITPDQDEEPVLGLKPTEIRYSHASQEDCRASLRYAGTPRLPIPPTDPVRYLDDQREEEGRYYQSS